VSAVLGEDPTCSVHREELAGWRCDSPSCRKYLCAQCAAKSVNQHYCCDCGTTASQLVVPRSDKSFTVWLTKAVTYPLSVGIPLVAITAVMLALISFVIHQIESVPGDWAFTSGILRGAIVLAFAITVADAAAHGNVAETGGAMRLGRGFVATMVVWVPAAFYLWGLGIPAGGVSHDKMLLLYAGLALIYLPIAIAVSVTDASTSDVANPFNVFELAWQLGRRYLATVITVAVLAAMTIGLADATVDKIRAAVPMPVVSDIAAALPTIALVGVLAYMIGLMSFVHGYRFGWADAPQYADPLHPKLVALGKRKAVQAAESTPEEAAAASAALSERNEARKISDAIKEDNFQRALKLYEAQVVWSASSFDERQLLLLGKAAGRSKKTDLARRLFDDIVTRNGRVAGHALVAIAQLHGQMGEDDKALVIYKQVVEQYPGSEAAKIASLKLK
jgi:hypothetical protein